MNNAQTLKLGTLPVRRIAESVWNHITGRGEILVRPYYADYVLQDIVDICLVPDYFGYRHENGI